MARTTLCPYLDKGTGVVSGLRPVYGLTYKDRICPYFSSYLLVLGQIHNLCKRPYTGPSFLSFSAIILLLEAEKEKEVTSGLFQGLCTSLCWRNQQRPIHKTFGKDRNFHNELVSGLDLAHTLLLQGPSLTVQNKLIKLSPTIKVFLSIKYLWGTTWKFLGLWTVHQSCAKRHRTGNKSKDTQTLDLGLND